MLLETLEHDKNNLIIFSQNIFNFESNFKILYKDHPDKKIEKIDYTEVCKFVDVDIPKNLLVYRLLTNIKKFEILYPKYGYYVLIQNSPELVYFDPVFAIKELENFDEELDFEKLRFRIQQVGLTRSENKNRLPVYRELYAVDLKANEAQNQNDSVFVEAYLSKLMLKKNVINSEDNVDNIKTISKLKSSNKNRAASANRFESFEERQKIIKDRAAELDKLKIKKEKKAGKDKFQLHQIEEDKNFDSNMVMGTTFPNLKNAEPNFFTIKENEKILNNTAERKIPMNNLKTEKTVKSGFSEYLKSKREIIEKNPDPSDSYKSSESDMIEIFKTNPSINKDIEDKKNRKIVLKIKDQ